MYPNYGQPQGNIGFNPNIGQQQAPPYPGGQQGVPYPSSQQPGFGQPPYPPAPGVPPLPGQQQQQPGLPGYAPIQPTAYPYSQTAPPPAYPPNPTPGYPQTQSAAYPPQGGNYPSAGAGYPSGVGAPPPTAGAPSWPQGPGYQSQQGLSQGPGYPQPQQGQGYPPQQGQGYPPQQGQGYPPQQGQGYPPQQGQGYPPQTQGYQSQGQPGSYPAPAAPFSSTSYPNTAAYPTQSYGQAPVAPTSASSYYNTSAPYSSASAAPVGHQQSSAMQAYVEKPSIHPPVHFDPAADAQALRKAMKGIGTDELAILNVICKRTNYQRLQITQAFKTSFGKDLLKDLKSELGGRFEDVVMALMTPRFDYLAMTVQRAISGVGTKERSLVDVLCTASNEEIRMISASYQRLYGRSLERDLMGDTSGHFRRLLVSITSAGRMENQPADPTLATNDAKALYDAGTNRIGTDESTFNQILCMRSFAHLRLVFFEYERTYGRSFEKVIENEFSGDIESGLKAVVACAKSRAAYFATRLHESFAGMGTKDDDLIFIMVTRCEIDLLNIKEEYQRNYNKTLSSAIASETSGDYKKALIALLGE